MAIDLYFFDASDDAISDPDSAWANDANAFSAASAPSASSSAGGSVSANYLFGGGTNAPTSGGAITQVQARIYGSGSNNKVSAAVYTDGLAELLETAEHQSTFTSLGDWVVLSVPSGGWTWAKIAALEVKFFSASSSGIVGGADIEVTSEVETDDEREAELHGTSSANTARPSELVATTAPVLTAAQVGSVIQLSWTHDPNP